MGDNPFFVYQAVTLNASYELVHQEEEAGFCKNESCQLEFYTCAQITLEDKFMIRAEDGKLRSRLVMTGHPQSGRLNTWSYDSNTRTIPRRPGMK